jgi:UDP:flavonoid glycosyltransferase YjiC (YdhE family)
MHLIVSGLGSYGDVLPMVGLGAAMRSRGHRVQMVANPYFREVIEEAGLELLSLGTAEEYLELAHHADLWHPLRGLKLVITQGAAKYLRATYNILRAHYMPGDTVLAAHGLDLASRILHDELGAPLATVHFAPFAIMTLYDTPRYIGVPSMRWFPRWLKAAQFWAGDRWVVDPLIAPAVNALRREIDLPPVSRIYTSWNQSPDLVLGMFPDWFGAPQPDWPPQTRLVGFPLYDPRPTPKLSAELGEFLDGGEPPIVFAPGSANTQAAEFFQTSVEVCRRLGRRGILLTKFREQAPAHAPPFIRHFDFVPFGLVLPRAAALVHHGGIGTCAQGLAAGLPQLVMAMAFDQLDNGQRLQRLGVGSVLRVSQFRPARVAELLAGLLASPTVADRARELSGRCNGPASLAAACEHLEALHAGRTAAAALG